MKESEFTAQFCSESKPVGDTQKVLIHIGTHKTGSTSLQQFLTRASARLLEDGILYPETGRPQAHAPYGHHLLAWSIQKKRGLNARTEWSGIVDEVAATSAPWILISSEEFESCTRNQIEKIKDFFPRFTVQALVYLRDPVDYIVSQYKQNISSSGETRSFRPFAEDLIDRCDYTALVQRWEKGLGEKVIVLSFEACRKKLGLEKSFLEAIGVDPQEYEPYIGEPANISPPERRIRVVRWLNKLQSQIWLPKELFHRVRRNVLRGSFKGRCATRVALNFLSKPLYNSRDINWLENRIYRRTNYTSTKDYVD